jgi:hypothetical protein
VRPLPDITVELAPWPPGTNVALYARVSELHMDDMAPPGLPVVATAAVAADRSLSYDVPVGSYWAIAPLNGRCQYLAVLAEDATFQPV